MESELRVLFRECKTGSDWVEEPACSVTLWGLTWMLFYAKRVRAANHAPQTMRCKPCEGVHRELFFTSIQNLKVAGTGMPQCHPYKFFRLFFRL
jgi:hypothetical protein